jgi:lipoyl(octanoyl) transferase
MIESRNKNVQTENWGKQKYTFAWNKQEKLLKSIIEIKKHNRSSKKSIKTPNYLIFLEHQPVYTIGKSGDQHNLLIDKSILSKKGVDFVKSNRGGDITFHGPGQLVVYPILDLENFFTDIHKYLRKLEDIIIQTLNDFGIKGQRSPGETGVWLDVGTPFSRKICAMGIRASRWVTMHGFALNINTDLNYFDNIIPCGIKGKGVTSMQKEIGKQIPFEEVVSKIKFYFGNIFEAKLTD